MQAFSQALKGAHTPTTRAQALQIGPRGGKMGERLGNAERVRQLLLQRMEQVLRGVPPILRKASACARACACEGGVPDVLPLSARQPS